MAHVFVGLQKQFINNLFFTIGPVLLVFIIIIRTLRIKDSFVFWGRCDLRTPYCLWERCKGFLYVNRNAAKEFFVSLLTL